MDIEKVLNSERVYSTASSVLLLFYFPLGIIVLVFRLFLSLNYICAQLVFDIFCLPENIVRRAFEKVFLAILGVVVVKRNEKIKDRKSLFISNKLTNVDGFFVSSLCNFYVGQQHNHSEVISKLLRSVHLPKTLKSDAIKALNMNGTSVLVQPEPYPTSGAGLLKFSDWSFDADVQIQPIAVRMKRHLPIAGTTLESTWWQDLLWTYFCILTIYDVTVLPCMSKESNESADEFSNRVQQRMASHLGIPCTSYNLQDVKELIKKKKFEARRPQQHIRIQDARQRLAPHIEGMVQQVKDILPHVPMAVIRSDIEKTNSVDVTVTNLLEGIVKFAPEPTQPPSTSKPVVASRNPVSQFSKSPVQRHMSLQEKKDEFLSKARDNYLRKRGLL